jgi:hypothetical protein
MDRDRMGSWDWHLVAEADAEDALAGGVEAADEADEVQDPGLVAVRVGAAPGDDEPVEAGRLGVGGELPADGAVHAPALAVLLQQRAEDGEVAAVLLPHVLRVLAALQHRVRARCRGGAGLRQGRGLSGRRGVLERPHSHGWRQRGAGEGLRPANGDGGDRRGSGVRCCVLGCLACGWGGTVGGGGEEWGRAVRRGRYLKRSGRFSLGKLIVFSPFRP